jgi:hypothetical protein
MVTPGNPVNCFRKFDGNFNNGYLRAITLEESMNQSNVNEYITEFRERYKKASKGEKGEILDEFIKLANYHRKAAIRLLNKANSFSISHWSQRAENNRTQDIASISSQSNLQNRHDRVHQAILIALNQLLMEHPLNKISIEAVARRSGVSKKTIYRWYPDKASIFMDLYGMNSLNALNIPDTGSLEKELTLVSLQIWRFWNETACGQAFRQLLASCQYDTKSGDELRDVFLPGRRKITQDIINRAIDRGEIEDKDYSFVVDIIMGFNIYHLLANSLNDESAIPLMTSVVTCGIKAVQSK